jgi:hypothetical protein
MKQHDAKSEDDERARFEQDAIVGGAARLVAIEISRPVEINRCRGNGKDGHRGQRGEYRDEQEDGALREGIADRAGDKATATLPA